MTSPSASVTTFSKPGIALSEGFAANAKPVDAKSIESTSVFAFPLSDTAEAPSAIFGAENTCCRSWDSSVVVPLISTEKVSLVTSRRTESNDDKSNQVNLLSRATQLALSPPCPSDFTIVFSI